MRIFWTIHPWIARRSGSGGREAEGVWKKTLSAPRIPLPERRASAQARWIRGKSNSAFKAARGLLIVWSLLATSGEAQPRYVLHAGLIKTQGYVVGAPLASSGFHRFEGGETWTHVGWNIPRVSGLAYDPANPDVIFLACGNGGLRTRDGGQSWRITTDWRVTEAQDVAIDPNEPAHVYLATAYGVWATTDQGDTWREVTSGIKKKYTQTVAVDRTQAGRVFAGMEGGLFLSEDRGRSWSQVASFEDVLDIQQSITDPQRWLAGTQNDGVLLSTDGGRSWQPARRRAIREATIYAVAIDPTDARRLAAVGWNTGVLLSTDSGRSWKRRGRKLPSPHFYEVVFDPTVSGRIWAATVEAGIFYSDDLGKNWTATGMDGTLVFDMIFIPDGPRSSTGPQ